MKEDQPGRRVFGFLVTLLVITNSCTRTESSEGSSDNGFIYYNYLEKGIHETLDPIEDLSRLSTFSNVPDSLFDEWIERFRKPGQKGNKMVSLEHQSKNYNAILICLVDELYVDNTDAKENGYSILTQYLLTLKDDGSYIDGLKVQEYLSKDRLDDVFVDGKEIMTRAKWSKFNGDTTLMFDKTIYIMDSVLSKREDYIETPDGRKLGTLETVLSVEFEGIDETTFVIDGNGKFKEVAQSKGILKKLAEQTGERIKPEQR
jgi:hypothetical protein